MHLPHSDVQQLSLPEPPGIKEEQELWTDQGGEQLPQVNSETTDSILSSTGVRTHCETTDSILSSTGVRTHCVVDDASQPPTDQTPTVNRDRDFIISNVISLQTTVESAEEMSGEAERQTEQLG